MMANRTKRYILDTSVYGVLPDKYEKDYEAINKIIDYAKRNKECFLTTFIISKELDSDKVSERIKRPVLSAYYLSISTSGVIELLHSDKFDLAKKLAWNYIQKLEKKDATKVMDDALNYAWASISNVDIFVTRNRRGILAKNYHPVLRKSNNKMKLGFVKILSPTEFYGTLI
ncbi:MAG: hypothetical protein KKB24_01765 [Candidatus Altiarchaeota archaeon]|nr:hypothetical protein [Candidatus Altiarchaeota archaeon]